MKRDNVLVLLLCFAVISGFETQDRQQKEIKGCQRPRVLLAAKTYAKHTLKSAITVGFSTFEGRSHVLAKTVRRCME